MKTIAIIMSEMDTGGVSEALIEMMRRFDYSRFDVSLWVAHGIGAEQNRIDPRVRVRYWGSVDPRKELINQLKRGLFLKFCRSIFYRVLGRIYINCNDKHTFYCVRSLSDINAEAYDYVICYQGVSPLAIPNALYRIHGRRKILWIHGDLGRENKYMPFCKKLYQQFDWAIGVSQAACELFTEQYSFPKDRTTVFHNIVDTERILRLAEESHKEVIKHPAIVTVGRLSPEKGQIMVPAAMRMLMDSGIEAWWYLIGDGSERCGIESEIRRQGVMDRVILLGNKANPFSYVRCADIYVQTSFTEGWCLTVQEARLLRKPVISTPLPAILEQITDGIDGLICDDISSEGLSRAVSLLLSDEVLRSRLAEGMNLSLEEHDEKMEYLYSIFEKIDRRDPI